MPEKLGLKSKFKRENQVTPGTYVEIASVAGITPPQLQRNMVDKPLLNPPDEIQQRLPGLIDAGEFSVTLNFDPANTGQDDLESDFWAGNTKNYQILFPDGSGQNIPAVVSGWASQEVEAEGVLQVEVTLTVMGKPTPVVQT